MPDNDSTSRRGNFLRGAGNAARGAGNAIRRSFNREVQGARNAIPGTQNHQWQQTLDALLLPGNLYNSETGQWQLPGAGTLRNLRGLFSPGAPESAPGQALPSWLMPGAVGAEPTNPLALPNYTDPNAWGPPESLAGPAPGLGVTRRPTARRGGLLSGNEIAAPLGIDTPNTAYVNPVLQFFDRTGRFRR